MIYNKDINALETAYWRNGELLQYAYDKDRTVVYSAESPVLKVMSYNVGQWYIGGGDNVPSAKDAGYYALQNGMIERADADILCINEYWDTFSKTGRTALSMLSQYYPYIQTQGGASGYYGRAICSKYPLTDYAHHSYANESARYYDSVTMMLNSIPITVVVTHLATDSKRIAQITELINYLKQLDRFICCGDYNTLTIRGAVTTEAQDYTDIIVPLLAEGFHLANCADEGFLITYSDSPTGTYVGCLDNIVTSENISVLLASVDETKLTDSITDRVDHMPLMATVQLN
jgi:endonuclease/exonuclease/phosphatase family metal-dependent hydrolase